MQKKKKNKQDKKKELIMEGNDESMDAQSIGWSS